jgi:undecaprenyl-diphosphatase
MAYFRREIVKMTVAFFRDLFSGRGLKGFSTEGRLAFYVILGTIPVGLVGLPLHKIIEGSLTKSTLIIISSLVALAALLWLAEKLARHVRDITATNWRDAVLIGIAQVCALIPGSSRSGTTITAALFLGFKREDGARFSFLLSIPAVFASGIYEMTKIHPSVFHLGITNLVIATIVSAVSGYVAISWLLKYLMKNTTMLFVWYRFALGILLTAFLMYGLIEP